MHSSGFVHTTADCVMTLARALSLMKSSLTQKQHRKERNVVLRLEKEIEISQ